MSVAEPAGRNVFYGVREHAMVAAAQRHGRARRRRSRSRGTFFVFSDYCRGAIRIAALSELPVDLRVHARQRRPR